MPEPDPLPERDRSARGTSLLPRSPGRSGSAAPPPPLQEGATLHGAARPDRSDDRDGDQRAMGRRLPAATLRPHGATCLLDHLPSLADDLSDAQLETARRVLRVPAIHLTAGRCSLDALQVDARTTGRVFGVVVTDGLLVREICVAGKTSIRLSGPGDLLGHQPDLGSSLPHEVTVLCPQDAELAILDDRTLLAMRHWPSMIVQLYALTMLQLDRSHISTAISQLTNVESRLLALFWQLADQWGHRRSEVIAIDRPLTHAAIGQLIGARRPTVSLGLRALERRNVLRRDPDGVWLLDPESLDTFDL